MALRNIQYRGRPRSNPDTSCCSWGVVGIESSPNIICCCCVARGSRNVTRITVPKTAQLSTTSEFSNCWGWVVDQEAHAHLARCCRAEICCRSSVDGIEDTLHGDLVAWFQFGHGGLPGKKTISMRLWNLDSLMKVVTFVWNQFKKSRTGAYQE